MEEGEKIPVELTEKQKKKLESDTQLVSDFKQRKLELEAKKNWDLFYKRNQDNFFRDRHWTSREFQDLCPDIDFTRELVMLEAGCGVGNFLFPFLQTFPNIFLYACDFSPRAVDFVKNHTDYDRGRVKAFVADVTAEEDSFLENIPESSVDIVVLVFVLSAIHPDKMSTAVKKLTSVVKLGGSIIIRDYGIYDHAMLRFSKGHRLSSQFYVRQDGTRAFYFTIDNLKDIFKEGGMDCENCYYVTRETVNRKEEIHAQRNFVQGRFRLKNEEISLS